MKLQPMGLADRDYMHQRREPPAAWERHHRTRRGIHPVVSLAIWVVILWGLYRGGEWLLAQRELKNRVPAAPVSQPVRSPTASDEVRSMPSPLDRPKAPQSTSYAVTKCIAGNGRAGYTDGPCPQGSRPVAVSVQPDINVADGMSIEARQASIQRNSAMAIESSQREVRIAQSNQVSVGNECAQIQTQIAWIDSAARQPQSAPMQDRLTEDKRQLRTRQFALHCQ